MTKKAVTKLENGQCRKCLTVCFTFIKLFSTEVWYSYINVKVSFVKICKILNMLTFLYFYNSQFLCEKTSEIIVWEYSSNWFYKKKC